MDTAVLCFQLAKRVQSSSKYSLSPKDPILYPGIIYLHKPAGTPGTMQVSNIHTKISTCSAWSQLEEDGRTGTLRPGHTHTNPSLLWHWGKDTKFLIHLSYCISYCKKEMHVLEKPEPVMMPRLCNDKMDKSAISEWEKKKMEKLMGQTLWRSVGCLRGRLSFGKSITAS